MERLSGSESATGQCVNQLGKEVPLCPTLPRGARQYRNLIAQTLPRIPLFLLSPSLPPPPPLLFTRARAPNNLHSSLFNLPGKLNFLINTFAFPNAPTGEDKCIFVLRVFDCLLLKERAPSSTVKPLGTGFK